MYKRIMFFSIFIAICDPLGINANESSQYLSKEDREKMEREQNIKGYCKHPIFNTTST